MLYPCFAIANFICLNALLEKRCFGMRFAGGGYALYDFGFDAVKFFFTTTKNKGNVPFAKGRVLPYSIRR